MPKPTKSYHHLKPEDRMTIASLMQQNYTQRDIAKLLGCSASTISRELGRNAQGKTYDSQSAQRACQHRRIASRPQRKLHTESILFGVVHTLMRSRWSPEQIALTLGQTYPKGHELRVSHETIYNCIYAQPVALAIGYGLGRYRAFSFQNHGEALVCRELQANFSGPDFHLLNHITLKIKDGTTQIDHILVYGRSRGAVEPLQLDMSTQPSSCAVVTTGLRSPQQEIVDLMAVALLRLRAAGPPPSHPSQTPTVNEVGKEELARRRFGVRVLTRMTDEG